MRHKDIQERLHGLDTSAADRLMDEYPPVADTEAQFRKTYDRYLAQTGEQDASPRRSPLRILRFAAYPVAAAACIALILAIAQNAPLTRPDDLTQQETPSTSVTTAPPETTAPLPAAETAAIATTAPVLATQETDVSLPAVTAAAVTQTAPTVTTKTAAASSTVTSAAPSPANASPTNDAGPTPTQAPTEAAPTATDPAPTQAPTEAAPPAVTDPPTTQAPTEAAPPSATDPPTTQAPTDPPGDLVFGSPNVSENGRFTVTPQPGSDTMLLRYELTTDDPVTVTEHRFDVPGFTESGRNIVNVSADVRATTVSLDDDAGQHYSVQIYPYEAFHMTYLTSYYTTAQENVANGLPIYLLASDDPEGIAMVFWDDGCQICFVISQVKDLGQMERLVSRITN
ncbi:MAG: hypothetical protein IKI21_06845 [Oscillospiraceae bacterium]|nr:hypothetical protein [Oscillospiraceae bacterium]